MGWETELYKIHDRTIKNIGVVEYIGDAYLLFESRDSFMNVATDIVEIITLKKRGENDHYVIYGVNESPIILADYRNRQYGRKPEYYVFVPNPKEKFQDLMECIILSHSELPIRWENAGLYHNKDRDTIFCPFKRDAKIIVEYPKEKKRRRRYLYTYKYSWKMREIED